MLNTRSWGFSLACFALLWSVGCSETPPNIVLILADDLGTGDVGAYGALRIATPNIDRLAAEGTRFANAYAPASVCSPSRYALMSGRYQWRSARALRSADILAADEPLQLHTDGSALPALLRQRGYHNAGIGKWHLGLGSSARTDWTRPLVPGPLEVGFDSYFGLPANADNVPRVWIRDRAVEAGPDAAPRRAVEVGPRLADEAVAFLQQVEHEPFFLYYAPTEPHIPIVPAPAFQGTSHAGPYGDFVQQLDAHVGRILAALESRGLEQRTLVVFTSDNGALLATANQAHPHTAAHREAKRLGHRSNGELRGQKHLIWEGGLRVPLIARWPGRIPAGRTRAELVSLVDFPATLAAVAGAPLPAGAGRDGVSLLPLLLARSDGPGDRSESQGEVGTAAKPRAIVMQSAQAIFALREGRFKLIERRESFPPPFSASEWLRKPDNPMNRWQLYDLVADESEEHNLWDPASAQASHLRERLDEIREHDPR